MTLFLNVGFPEELLLVPEAVELRSLDIPTEFFGIGVGTGMLGFSLLTPIDGQAATPLSATGIGGVFQQFSGIHCLATSAFCLAALNLPASQPLTNSGPVMLQLGPIRFASDVQTLRASPSFSGPLLSGTLQLVGHEIGRTLVPYDDDLPEPAPFALLALGLAGLWLASRRGSRTGVSQFR